MELNPLDRAGICAEQIKDLAALIEERHCNDNDPLVSVMNVIREKAQEGKGRPLKKRPPRSR